MTISIEYGNARLSSKQIARDCLRDSKHRDDDDVAGHTFDKY